MRRFQISTILMLGMLTALLTSCSRNPMSPEIGAQNGAQMMGGAQADDAPSGFEGGGIPGTATTALSVGSEARLTVGRFTLDLHKNSLKANAQITLHVASEDAMEVQIVVTPASAANLQVAADLTANMSDLPDTDYLNTTVYDWGGTDWVAGVDVASHPNQKNVVTKLQTIGTHRVGPVAPADDKWKNK